jgi:DNA-binding response OmpR family regulator
MNDTNSSQQLILIIDDMPSPVKILPMILTEAGFKVWWALSGKQAFKVIEKRQPDLILLDIMMPKMDGFEVCQHLKSQKQTRDIPIIFMSARDDTADKAKAFELGAADYITKPIQAGKLLACIKTHLG